MPPLEGAVNQVAEELQESEAGAHTQLPADRVEAKVDLKVEDNFGLNSDAEDHFWIHRPFYETDR